MPPPCFLAHITGGTLQMGCRHRPGKCFFTYSLHYKQGPSRSAEKQNCESNLNFQNISVQKAKARDEILNPTQKALDPAQGTRIHCAYCVSMLSKRFISRKFPEV